MGTMRAHTKHGTGYGSRKEGSDIKRVVVNRWVNTQAQDLLPQPGENLEFHREATTADCNELASECWCGVKRVWVPQRYPRAGLTMSCGASRCQPPQGVAYEVGEPVPQNIKGVR